MSKQRRSHLDFVSLSSFIAIILLLGMASEAHAYHDESTFVTEDTAYTLKDGEWRLGIWRLDYGLTESLDIGTYTPAWIGALVGAYITNAHLKYELWSNEDWVASVRAGFFYFNIQQLSDGAPPISMGAFPIEFVTSYRATETITTSFSGVFTKLVIDGEGGGESDLLGSAAVTNLYLGTNIEWRLSDVTALYIQGRFLSYQDLSSAVSATIQVDAATEVKVVGLIKSDAVDVKGGGSLLLGAVWSWENFNLRFGLGQGNWFIPPINYVTADKGRVVEFDMYWRW